MGRIKTKAVKRITMELVENHFSEFSEDFNKNKGIVEMHTDIPSKKLRNIITGYVTRLVKSRETL
ncbi:TPA: 30S ribosomal protein S17e [Candidatus Woesearchaeota archaeon]|nr:30S ribosomal protein S17e [archaeon GW2011_AR15]MBS3104278.1 30S ribosomal protein S17e [Candidatus Woesearchaeota archaeon]HIH41844.1 30S ribosomal protein S17e [Candidatus Woesearchaeota archaeon]